jgi:hypothetical protein
MASALATARLLCAEVRLDLGLPGAFAMMPGRRHPHCSNVNQQTSRLSALFVVGVLIHNIEELVWLPAWSQSAGQWHQAVATPIFAFAVTVLSVLLISLAFASSRCGPQSVPTYLFAGYVFAMIANALIAHLAASALTRSYVPGTATAVLLNVPIGSILLRRLLVAGDVSLQRMYWWAPLVAICLLVSIPVLFKVGAQLGPLFSQRAVPLPGVRPGGGFHPSGYTRRSAGVRAWPLLQQSPGPVCLRAAEAPVLIGAVHANVTA